MRIRGLLWNPFPSPYPHLPTTSSPSINLISFHFAGHVYTRIPSVSHPITSHHKPHILHNLYLSFFCTSPTKGEKKKGKGDLTFPQAPHVISEPEIEAPHEGQAA